VLFNLFFFKKNPIKKEKKKFPRIRFVINFHPNNLYEIFVDADEVLGLFLKSINNICFICHSLHFI
jgi:hypothetical protein